VNGLPFVRLFAARGRHANRAEFGRASAAGASAAAAQLRTYAGEQLGGAKGFRQIVVGAASSAATLSVSACVPKARSPGSPTSSQITDEVDAVTVGQAQIEHHQVGAAGAGLDQAALQAVGLEYLEPLAFERQLDEAADVGFIFDDDNGAGSVMTLSIDRIEVVDVDHRLVGQGVPPSAGTTISSAVVGGVPRGSEKTKRAPPPARFSA
jgi:hypothetical protein